MSRSGDFSPFLSKIALGAGAILLKYLGKKHKIKYKPGAGIVTEADLFAEQYLLNSILKKYPKSTILSEEAGKVPGSPDLQWVIDPLDGTSNYAHGFPWFCVSVGLFEKGALKAGAIFNPVLKELYTAEAKRGAFLNGKRIRVSKTRKISDALLATGFYYAEEATLKREMKIFENMHRHTSTVRRPGSAALDLACVASGRFDGFWERGLAPWDVAAGFLLVAEAGGTVSDYRGSETGIHGSEVLASNGVLHAPLVKILKDPEGS